jgi:hypothetical protein
MRVSIEADNPAGDQLIETSLLVIVADIPVGDQLRFEGEGGPGTVYRRHAGGWDVTTTRRRARYTDPYLVVQHIIRYVTAPRDVTAELLGTNNPTVCEPGAEGANLMSRTEKKHTFTAGAPKVDPVAVITAMLGSLGTTKRTDDCLVFDRKGKADTSAWRLTSGGYGVSFRHPPAKAPVRAYYRTAHDAARAVHAGEHVPEAAYTSRKMDGPPDWATVRILTTA